MENPQPSPSIVIADGALHPLRELSSSALLLYRPVPVLDTALEVPGFSRETTNPVPYRPGRGQHEVNLNEIK